MCGLCPDVGHRDNESLLIGLQADLGYLSWFLHRAAGFRLQRHTRGGLNPASLTYVSGCTQSSAQASKALHGQHCLPLCFHLSSLCAGWVPLPRMLYPNLLCPVNSFPFLTTWFKCYLFRATSWSGPRAGGYPCCTPSSTQYTSLRSAY